MGYITTGDQIVIDAVLTKAGRQALAKGDGSFKITQFALGDDEIDYSLYNATHPNGTAYAGEAIENLPVIEAFTDDTVIMKYKLVTLNRGTTSINVLSSVNTSYTLVIGTSQVVTPSTNNFASNTAINESYTFTVGDSRLFSVIEGAGSSDATVATDLSVSNNQIITSNVSKSVIGKTLKLTATTNNAVFGTNTQLSTTLSITGKTSGASITVPITIKKSA
jgi:hypothetical protein